MITFKHLEQSLAQKIAIDEFSGFQIFAAILSHQILNRLCPSTSE